MEILKLFVKTQEQLIFKIILYIYQKASFRIAIYKQLIITNTTTKQIEMPSNFNSYCNKQ